MFVRWKDSQDLLDKRRRHTFIRIQEENPLVRSVQFARAQLRFFGKRPFQETHHLAAVLFRDPARLVRAAESTTITSRVADRLQAAREVSFLVQHRDDYAHGYGR